MGLEWGGALVFAGSALTPVFSFVPKYVSLDIAHLNWQLSLNSRRQCRTIATKGLPQGNRYPAHTGGKPTEYLCPHTQQEVTLLTVF